MANISRSRKSGFTLRSGVMRRETFWIGVGISANALASANSAALINSASAGLLAVRPFTIVRTRGNWVVRSDQLAASEDLSVGIGYAVVSDQATAIGVSAVPTPFTDIGSDMFFVYEQWLQSFRLNTAVGTEAYNSVSYDSKAMRKVNDGQDIVTVIENSGVSAGSNVVNSGRMLIKIH